MIQEDRTERQYELYIYFKQQVKENSHFLLPGIIAGMKRSIRQYESDNPDKKVK